MNVRVVSFSHELPKEAKELKKGPVRTGGGRRFKVKDVP